MRVLLFFNRLKYFKKLLQFSVACPGGYEEIPVQDDQLTASSVFAGNKTEHDSEREYAATNSRINNSVNKG